MATGRRKAFEIAGRKVAAGSRATIEIPVARLYTHAAMTIPVHVVHGRQEGPRLFVCAAIHGDELVGVEIVRRLIKLKKVARLKGTLIAVPVVNVYGFIHQSRYLPDRRDLNRFFPGSPKGSLTSQLAAIFMEEVVARSTHGIDLHAGSNHRVNLPQIRASLDVPETRALALAFKAPVVIDAATREGSLRRAVIERGTPMLVYEAGEALRFDEVAIQAGLRGVLAVMAALGMISRSLAGRSRVQPLVTAKTSWVRAPASGIFHSRVPLGGRVASGMTIGAVVDPFGQEEIDIVAPDNGMVIGHLNFPLVHRGDAIVHIAHLDSDDQIEPTLEDFQEEIGAAEGP